LNALERDAPGEQAEEPVATVCAGGYRSSIASSILERKGFRRITNVVGGMAAWTQAGLETSSEAPPDLTSRV
jgi:hydroxyacylglutathione hydrolase